MGLPTCAIHPSDLHHRLPVSVPNAARGRVAPSLSCRKRDGAGRLTVQLVLLRALRPVTSSNNVRHARLRSVRPHDWRHRPSVSHPGTAPCTSPRACPFPPIRSGAHPFPPIVYSTPHMARAYSGTFPCALTILSLSGGLVGRFIYR